MSGRTLSAAQNPPPVPAVGTIMIDEHDRIGEFLGEEHGQWWLRPLKGGTEWTVKPGEAEPAPSGWGLRAKVALVNERTARRGELT
ncbi:hypothetical protein ACSCBZ_37850 [Streptomyces niveiscabiei]|uniref:hypothetical protein n=1 Tax=Streptomyces TaxID=1883 RepID=UPI0007C85C84|nr:MULTISPECIES: hypothetical protein [Streptomyces]